MLNTGPGLVDLGRDWGSAFLPGPPGITDATSPGSALIGVKIVKPPRM